MISVTNYYYYCCCYYYSYPCCCFAAAAAVIIWDDCPNIVITVVISECARALLIRSVITKVYDVWYYSMFLTGCSMFMIHFGEQAIYGRHYRHSKKVVVVELLSIYSPTDIAMSFCMVHPANLHLQKC